MIYESAARINGVQQFIWGKIGKRREWIKNDREATGKVCIEFQKIKRVVRLSSKIIYSRGFCLMRKGCWNYYHAGNCTK